MRTFAQLTDAIKNCVIRAPFAGTVAQRYVGAGSVAGALTPILRVIQSEDLHVRFAVPVDQSREVSIGEPISIQVETLSAPLAGEIENISPEVEPASQMLFVEARLLISRADQQRLRAGLVAHVTARDEALVVELRVLALHAQ